ncbi:Nicotinamide-nucleotide amidohydrolase PncC [Methylobacterium bullatum]|uniref:Nicotinamide-nucleotide amidohydrolase PncC n=1 Tax=Methylobacterium bullatum TaxID=570505 RepID=A0A679JMQ6_9HYPH|nr:Nicotinamide-nucleotide amidohydrolase PncC [Methylobacterium bullatum]
MIDDPALLARAEALVAAYAAAGLRAACAESCTGGLVAGLLTAVPGSSAVVERGFVTYSNDAKSEMLGVPADLIATHGAVSKSVARAMAEGALAHSHADVAVSITGIAGPGGGSEAKPVGLVHFGLARRGAATRHIERRFGDLGRGEIRRAAVAEALELFGRAVEPVGTD